MKRIFLGAFILFDLSLIGASGYVLFRYVRDKMPRGGFPSLPRAGVSPKTAPQAAEKTTGGLLTPPASTTESSTRKIRFSYRNSRAKHVSIRADFTGWKAVPMDKAAGGQWTYTAALTPGEYAYCYTVDDRTFKDPAAKRTKVIGRTTVSAIVVEALPAKASK